MKLVQRFPITAFATVLLSLVGYCAAQNSVELMFVSGALAALSWYITEGPRGRTLPRWVSNVLVTAVLLSVAVDLLRAEGILIVIGRLCVWLTLIKLYERRTARDHGHLLGLSLLLMLIGCLQSTDLLFGIVLLVYAGLGLYALVLYQLYGAQESVAAARKASCPVGSMSVPPLRPTIGRHVTGQFRALVAGVGLAGILLSAVLFTIFPRGATRGMFNQLPVTSRITGYTDEIDLEGGTRITKSNRPVFDLELLDEEGEATVLDGPLLLRGAALDTYRDGRWSASSSASLRIETRAGEPVFLSGVGDGVAGRIRQRFRFQSPTETLFSLYLPTTIESARSSRISYGPGTQTLRTALDGEGIREYTVRSRPAPSDDLVASVSRDRSPGAMAGGFFQVAMQPPAQRVQKLAHSVLANAGLPLEPKGDEQKWALVAASVFADHLRSEAFQYTLDMSDVLHDGEDPVVQFLFDSQRGHCEFFASALAAMCHTVGIDARVVTGYVATEFDEAAGRYVVLARNAHAWVEVRSGEYVYTAIDPTPPAVLKSMFGGRPSFTQRLGWFYQRLDGSWRSSIIDFNSRSQARLIESMDLGWSRRIANTIDSLRDWAERVNLAFSFGPMGYVWLGLVALAAVLAVMAALKITKRIKALRRALHVRRLRDSESRRFMSQLGFYLDMLAALRKGGVEKPWWQTPLAFSHELVETSPDAGCAMRRITDVYYEARYGGRRLTGREISDIRQLVQELSAMLEVRT